MSDQPTPPTPPKESVLGKIKKKFKTGEQKRQDAERKQELADIIPSDLSTLAIYRGTAQTEPEAPQREQVRVDERKQEIKEEDVKFSNFSRNLEIVLRQAQESLGGRNLNIPKASGITDRILGALSTIDPEDLVRLYQDNDNLPFRSAINFLFDTQTETKSGNRRNNDRFATYFTTEKNMKKYITALTWIDATIRGQDTSELKSAVLRRINGWGSTKQPNIIDDTKSGSDRTGQILNANIAPRVFPKVKLGRRPKEDIPPEQPETKEESKEIKETKEEKEGKQSDRPPPPPVSEPIGDIIQGAPETKEQEEAKSQSVRLSQTPIGQTLRNLKFEDISDNFDKKQKELTQQGFTEDEIDQAQSVIVEVAKDNLRSPDDIAFSRTEKFETIMSIVLGTRASELKQTFNGQSFSPPGMIREDLKSPLGMGLAYMAISRIADLLSYRPPPIPIPQMPQNPPLTAEDMRNIMSQMRAMGVDLQSAINAGNAQARTLFDALRQSIQDLGTAYQNIANVDRATFQQTITQEYDRLRQSVDAIRDAYETGRVSMEGTLRDLQASANQNSQAILDSLRSMGLDKTATFLEQLIKTSDKIKEDPTGLSHLENITPENIDNAISQRGDVENGKWRPKAIMPSTDTLDMPEEEIKNQLLSLSLFDYVQPSSEGAEGTIDTNPLKKMNAVREAIRYSGSYDSYIASDTLPERFLGNLDVPDLSILPQMIPPRDISQSDEEKSTIAGYEEVLLSDRLGGKNPDTFAGNPFSNPYARYSDANPSRYELQRSVLYTLCP